MKTITWGIIESFDLSECNPIFEISKPSIIILPLADSMMRNKARVSEDFPAPVRPTTPIYINSMLKSTVCRLTDFLFT